MCEIIKFETDFKVDADSRKCKAIVALLTIKGAIIKLSFDEDTVEKLISVVYDNISEKFEDRLAKHVCVELKCKFSVYQYYIEGKCKEKGIPFDLYYKASE